MVKTRDLIVKIAHENQIPVGKVEEIIKILENEWYTEAETLQEISEQQWKTLGIPSRMVGLIKKFLSEKPPVTSLSRESIFAKLVDMLSQNPQDLIALITVFQQIVFNILNFGLPKYKVIKLSNTKFHQSVGRFPLAIDYLRSIGFSLVTNELQMISTDTALLEDALTEINKIAQNLSIPVVTTPEKFNPYKSSLINFGSPKLVSGDNDPIAITAEINNIKRQRAEIVKKISISRNPRVYRANQNSFISEEEVPEEVDFEIMKNNIKDIMLKRETSSNFQNKRKNQLEKLRSKEFIAKVVIRVKFDDGFLLEGNFSLTETINDVYEFVTEHLETSKDFYLFMIPPKKIIQKSNEKLANYGPASLLYFSWSDGSTSESYLSRSLRN